MAAVFCGGLAFMGAAFAPSDLSFRWAPDPLRLGLPAEPKIISGPVESRPSSSRRNAALSRAEELILTERAIATSA